jgi:hypothetical protein
MRAVCDGVLVVDTHVSFDDQALERLERETFWVDPATLGPIEARPWAEREYRGRSFLEHPPDSTAEQRLESGWASLDNPTSFWLTKPSLVNLLVDAGFPSVLEDLAPRLAYPPDRVTLVALGRGGQRLRAIPAGDQVRDAPLDEHPPHVRSASS